MARKLVDISKLVHSKASAFREHLENTASPQVLDLLNLLSSKCDIYIFSGVIRNYFLKIPENRDIDVIYDGDIDIEMHFNKYKWGKNSFGGYKILVDRTSLDIWQLQNTWALHYQGTFDFDLAKFIPNTAFFNFSSIVYSYSENKFIFSLDFIRFLQRRRIDLTFAPNANVALCIVNSLYYSDKLKKQMGLKLIRYIKQRYKRVSNDYEKVQLKHFGKILYTRSTIINRIDSLSEPNY